MACCYSKALLLSDSNIKSVKKNVGEWLLLRFLKKKSLPSPHSWIYYIFGKKHIIVLSPFKKKKSHRHRAAEMGFVIHHLPCIFLITKKKTIMLYVNLHLISEQFLSPSYGFTRQEHNYYMWFVLSPLVKFCTSLQYYSLNVIGYGNVEYCRPLVLLMLWNLASAERHIPQRNKHSLMQTPTVHETGHTDSLVMQNITGKPATVKCTHLKLGS